MSWFSRITAIAGWGCRWGCRVGKGLVHRWLGAGRLRIAPDLTRAAPVWIDPEDDGPPEHLTAPLAEPGPPIDAIFLPSGVLKVPDGTTVELGQLADGTYYADWTGPFAPTWYPATGPAGGANPFGDNPATPDQRESVVASTSVARLHLGSGPTRIFLGGSPLQDPEYGDSTRVLR